MRKGQKRPQKTAQKPVETNGKPAVSIESHSDQVIEMMNEEPITEEKIQLLEPQFRRLLKPQGFIEAFWEFLSYYQQHEDAYEAVERQFEAQFGHRKYASFESFRICRDKFLKKEK